MNVEQRIKDRIKTIRHERANCDTLRHNSEPYGCTLCEQRDAIIKELEELTLPNTIGNSEVNEDV